MHCRRQVVDHTRVHVTSRPSSARTDRLNWIRMRLETETLEQRFEMPELPAAALELGRLASSIDPDMRTAVRVVERDPQLAGRVLRVAGAAAFGPSPPRDLHAAAMRLGVRGLRDVAFAASMGRVFRCADLEDRVREEIVHAFVVGVGSAVACRALGADVRIGFVAGLLHNVGRLALLTALARWSRDEPRLLEPRVVEDALSALHHEVAAVVLVAWGVPTAVLSVAAFLDSPSDAGPAAGLTRAVALADRADMMRADTPEECAAGLAAAPLAVAAGVEAAAIEAIARGVHRARGDEILSQLVG